MKEITEIRKGSLKKILVTINDIRQTYWNVRHSFPYIKLSRIGDTEIPAAPFYRNRNFPESIKFSEPITPEFRIKHNQTAHWINQSFVIRFQALMEYHKFAGTYKYYKDSAGYIEMDFLRQLRHVFAHSNGRYNPNNKSHIKLRGAIIKYFNVRKINKKEIPEDDFTLDIKQVMEPLIEGCIKYVKINYSKPPELKGKCC